MRLPLALLIGTLGCGTSDAHEPTMPSTPNVSMNFSARKICCLERATSCADGNDACTGCDDRCFGGCANGGPLFDCMNAKQIALTCPADGSIRPANGLCQQEFDDYQAAARSCGPAACAVGGAALAGGRAGSGGSS